MTTAPLIERFTALAETFDAVVLVSEVSRQLGISQRALQQAVRDHYHTSPARYLRTVRLRRVRQALLTPQAGAKVTRAAAEFGFHELGRFAAMYRQQFAELPSATLRRVRSGHLPQVDQP